MGGFADLYRARGGHTRVTLMKIQAGVLPLEPELLNQCACVGFQIAGRILVVNIDKSIREFMPVVIHQASVANVVPRHLPLIVGVQVGIGKKLLETRKTRIHRPTNQVDDSRVWQRRENQRQMQVVHGQFVDKTRRLAANSRARLKVHVANLAMVRVG